MQAHFQWNQKQKDVLSQMALPFDYNVVDEDQLADFEDLVGTYLQEHGDGGGELNEIGLTCETILDEIAKV
ncbi:MAG: hypothetical protein GX418_04385 [Clostridiales bacterium]|nr:hypothetical protein [Clostridiales bacterium]